MTNNKDTNNENLIKKPFFSSIEEIEEKTRRGYINDLDEIRDIYERLLDLKMNEFDSEDNSPLLNRISGLFFLYDIDEESYMDITLAEFIGLISGIDKLDKLSDEEKKQKWMYLTLLRRILINSNYEVDLVTLFMNCSVLNFTKSLTHSDNLEEKSREKQMRLLVKMNHIRHISNANFDFTFYGDTTVHDLIVATREYINSNWVPWKSIENYQKEIECAYEITYEILVSMPVLAMPERFNVKKILQTRKKKEEDIFTDFLNHYQNEKIGNQNFI